MSDIEQIKSRIDAVEYIGQTVKLKKAGRNYKGLCPFHNEKTPSFIVSPDRNRYHCFGCGKDGSVIDFVMEHEQVDFVEALETLAEKAGVTLTKRAPTTAEGKRKKRIYEANHLASEYYHYLLTKHTLGERARTYLKERGVKDKTAKTFGLGYSPNSWEGLLTFLKKKGFDGRTLEDAGLVIKGKRGYYDRFRGRVMFTLKDHRGNVVGFAGRTLDPKAKEAKYINTPETLVYVKRDMLYGLDVTKRAIQDANEAIVTEGEFGVIALFQAGISNVVAIKGSALTQSHVKLLKRFCEKLIFALDSDVAGDAASRRGIAIADKAGFDMKVVKLPEGKDPDDVVAEGVGIFKKLIKDAVPVYTYYLSSALARYNVGTSYGKRKISEELLPIIGAIDNPIIQGHYVKKLAHALEVSEDAVVDGMRRVVQAASRGVAQTVAKQEPTVQKSREERLERELLALLLQAETRPRHEELVEYVSTNDMVTQSGKQIMKKLAAWLVKEKTFLVKDFADSLPPELERSFDEAYLYDLSDVAGDVEQSSKYWVKILRAFRSMVLKKKIKEATQALSHAMEEKQEGKISKIQKTLTEYTAALKTVATR